jgi:putative FmdB family regulatory protein
MALTRCWSKNVPLYEYECDACGRRFEVIQKFSDGPVEICRECGKGPVRRLLSSPAIQFKGSGWYVTDYAQKGKSDSSSSTPSAKTGDGSKSDTSTDSGSGKSDSGKSDSGKSESGKSDSGRTDSAKTDSAKTSTPSSASKSKDS